MEAVRTPEARIASAATEELLHDARQERWGVLFAVLCAINGAFVPAVANVTTRAADPFLVTLATTWFAGFAALVVLLARGQLRVLWAPRYAVQLALLGALGTALAFTLFFTGASRATAVETVLALQSEPVYSLLLSWLVLGHKPSGQRVAATLCILAGLAVAFGREGLSGSSGIAYLLATPLCWQLSHLIVLRWLPGISPDVLAGARYLWGTAFLAVIGASVGAGSDGAAMPGLPWGWVAVQGCVLSYGGTMLWYGAVTRIDLARATVLVVPTVPLLSLVTSFILLGEVPNARQAVGVAIAALGVYVFARRGVPPRVLAAKRAAVGPGKCR